MPLNCVLWEIQNLLEIEPYVTEYLIIIFLGLFVTFLYNLFASQLRSMGNTKFALIFLIISIICNIFFDIIFIKYLHLGINGAAWATVISQGISALLCFSYIKKNFAECIISKADMIFDGILLKKTLYFASISALHQSSLYIGKILVQGAVNTAECIISKADMIFDGILLKKTLYFASISALHQSSLYIGKILVQGAVNTLGAFGIAAYTATNRIEGIANTFAISGTDAISVFIAQNIGAGNKKRAFEGFKTSMPILLL